jgi:beta-carotene 3-hydroxylase
MGFTVISVALFLTSFVVMEGVTYLVHRYVMHGIGIVLHVDHHRVRKAGSRFERNDLYPVAFAAIVCAAFAVGFNVASFAWLVPVCLGVTAYGAAYAFVHDVSIHGRLGRSRALRSSTLQRLADAHALHHRFNGEPYGMLFPVVPASLRQRAADSGSRPSQVPLDA